MNDIERIRQALRLPAYEEALAARLGLNVTDLRALELVVGNPGITPGGLAERSGLTSGAVTGVVDRLERAGYLERRPDPADRRSVTIHPVEARTAELAAARAQTDRDLERLLAKHDAAQRAAILEFLGAAAAAVERGAARLRAEARGGFVADQYIAPLAGATHGRLAFASGAPRLALNVAPFGPEAAARIIMETSASRLEFRGAAGVDQLLRASFDGPRPEVTAAAGVATIRYRRKAIAAFSGRAARIALAPAIPWTVELSGGITDLTGSLEGVALERLEVDGGANHVDLTLPEPSGTVPVRVFGVASVARFRRPAGVPVAVRVDGGISRLRIDGERFERVAGDRRFTSERFASSADRYEIEVLGGASEIRVEGR
ncbi:MAG TPA: MarR family transcriptional regulator [Candidatus Binatia bacterium]|nr:MarR family transcriptional regulator [Candidatus Binatia bacterium]